MAKQLRLLNISKDGNPRILREGWFRDRLRQFGELVVLSGGHEMTAEQVADHARGCDVYVVGWDCTPLPASLAGNPGRLKYVCGVTGSMRGYVPQAIVDAGIPVTNWGDAPAIPVAEGAVALLLAVLKDLHHRVQLIRGDGWQVDRATHGGSLDGLKLGVYGAGVIGLKFIEMVRPFGPVIKVFDPFLAEVPEGVTRVDSLDALFDDIQAVAIHAGWTPETDKSVNARLLAKLPKHGVVINTARGGIVDQDALFAELATGRLRAGLDVFEPDYLPPGHPARKWENLIVTSHSVAMSWPEQHERVGRMYEYALDNLQRFVDGRPLRFVMDPVRYARST